MDEATMSCIEPISIPGLAARRAANNASPAPVVLVVDHDPFWRRLVARKLSPGAIVRPAPTLADAEAMLRSAPVAGVVLELDLPDGSALPLLRQIRLATKPLPVLVLSESSSVLAASTASALGADFASKHEPMNAVAPRIEQLVSRLTKDRDHISELVAEMAVRGSLTRAEREALEVFLRTGNRACLAGELGIAETSVKSRVRSLCRKLGLSHLAEIYRVLFELESA
jgi:DNA-binding NarL/FixJ family response regulator